MFNNKSIFNFIILSFLILALSSCKNPHRIRPSIDELKREKKQMGLKGYVQPAIHIEREKLIKEMNFQEAYNAMQKYKVSGDIMLSKKCAERAALIGSCEHELADILLELAQSNLENGDLKNAEEYASKYEKFFPGMEESENAGYIHIRAKFLKMSSADKDQSNTIEIIELIKKFLNMYGTNSRYVSDMKKMAKAAYLNLFESEINIINGYLSRYYYYKRGPFLKSAKKRSEYLRKNLLQYNKDQEARLIYLEIEIAQAFNDNKLVEEKKNILKTKFVGYNPDGVKEKILKVARKF